jgi:hypothetical protein
MRAATPALPMTDEQRSVLEKLIRSRTAPRLSRRSWNFEVTAVPPSRPLLVGSVGGDRLKDLRRNRRESDRTGR